MILTFRKSQSLGDVYLLTLLRRITHIGSNEAKPIDIWNFLENHYRERYTECENYDFQEINETKLRNYVNDVEENAHASGTGKHRFADDDFYDNIELINILIKLDPEEEKAFIPSLKVYMSGKSLTYNVDT
jgi:hypothetical protein